MHTLNDVSTIIKYSTNIFCVDSTCKMWITGMTFIATSCTYSLDKIEDEFSPNNQVEKKAQRTKNSSRMKNFARVTSASSSGSARSKYQRKLFINKISLFIQFSKTKHTHTHIVLKFLLRFKRNRSEED